MRGLLSKTELRELEIIEFLAVQSDYVTINTLANKIHYSSRTIQSDLKTLSNYESYFTLHTTNAGVRLVFKKSTSIENIYYDFVKNSDSFRLLNLLFLNPKITINELVSELFISKSSLLIIRKNANQILQSYYGFEIDKSFHLVGDEKNIRLFFLRLYFDSFPMEVWPFEGIIDRAKIYKFNKEIFKYFEVYDETIIYRITILVMINYIRSRQGHSIEEGESDFKLFKNITPQIRTKFKLIFGCDLSSESIKEFFYPYINNELLFYKSFHKDYHEDRSQDPSIQYLKKNLPALAKKLGLPLKNEDRLIRIIHNDTILFPFYIAYYKNLLIRSNINTLDLRDTFLPINPLAIENFIDEYLTFINRPLENLEEIKENITHVLISNWEDFVPEMKQHWKPLKVGVYTSIGKQHTKMVCDYFAVSISDSIANIVPIAEKKLFNDSYDIILTDIVILQNQLRFHQKSMIINLFPSRQDVLNLMDLIINN